MAIVSGYTITKEQYKELKLLYETDTQLQVTPYRDGSVTIDDGDTVYIEFVPESETHMM